MRPLAFTLLFALTGCVSSRTSAPLLVELVELEPIMTYASAFDSSPNGELRPGDRFVVLERVRRFLRIERESGETVFIQAYRGNAPLVVIVGDGGPAYTLLTPPRPPSRFSAQVGGALGAGGAPTPDLADEGTGRALTALGSGALRFGRAAVVFSTGLEGRSYDVTTTVRALGRRQGYTYDATAELCRQNSSGQAAPLEFCFGRRGSVATEPTTTYGFIASGGATWDVRLGTPFGGGILPALTGGAGASLTGSGPLPYGTLGLSLSAPRRGAGERGRASVSAVVAPERIGLNVSLFVSI